MNKDHSDSDLPTSLPAAAAALSAEDRAGLINALKNKLQNLALEHSDIFERLSPRVRKRVDALKELQRYEIVNGIVEVEGVSVAPVDQGDNKGTGDGTDKGIPNFWLTAMLNNEILVDEISEDDEEALEFLKDIKCCGINDPKGFKLEFFFDANPFFKNSVLTKTYHMIGDDEPLLEKAIGTDIEWYPGKCLTRKTFKKRQNKELKIAKREIIEDIESFFNFFKPPQVPEDDGYDLDSDAVEKLQNQMEQDYEIGSIIRNRVIPHAVSFFTGELAESDDHDDTEDEEEEEEEDEVCEKKPSGPKVI